MDKIYFTKTPIEDDVPSNTGKPSSLFEEDNSSVKKTMGTRFPLLSHQRKELDNRFTYHSPKNSQPERYESIREKAKEFAILITQCCPESRETEVSMVRLEEAVFWANASIARNE